VYASALYTVTMHCFWHWHRHCHVIFKSCHVVTCKICESRWSLLPRCLARSSSRARDWSSQNTAQTFMNFSPSASVNCQPQPQSIIILRCCSCGCCYKCWDCSAVNTTVLGALHKVYVLDTVVQFKADSSLLTVWINSTKSAVRLTEKVRLGLPPKCQN